MITAKQVSQNAQRSRALVAELWAWRAQQQQAAHPVEVVTDDGSHSSRVTITDTGGRAVGAVELVRGKPTRIFATPKLAAALERDPERRGFGRFDLRGVPVVVIEP